MMSTALQEQVADLIVAVKSPALGCTRVVAAGVGD